MTHDLHSIAGALVADGKGILAADETAPTLTKRLDALGITSTEESRRAYREMLFTAPGADEFISGVIMYDETIRQKSSRGTPLAEVLRTRGIVPGIKVDTGAKPLAGSPRETVTEGLDGLRDRLAEYHAMGARFAKWRAVIRIADALPTPACVSANAHALGAIRRALPGATPGADRRAGSADGWGARDRPLRGRDRLGAPAVFDALYEQGVSLSSMLLKPSMVIAGSERGQQASVEEVATATLACLRRHVPAAVPGIVFLSGGQSDRLATAHLNAINRLPGPGRGRSASPTGARSRTQRFGGLAWARREPGARAAGPVPPRAVQWRGEPRDIHRDGASWKRILITRWWGHTGRPDRSGTTDDRTRHNRNRGRRSHGARAVGQGTGPDRRVLASRQLPFGRPDLPLRQPAAEEAADQGAHQAAAARPLGNDARPELHLRPSEPRDQAARPEHDLHHRPRPRRTRAGRERLSRGHLQRGLSEHLARTRRA